MLRRFDLPPVWMTLSGLLMLLIALWTPWRLDADLPGWLAMILGAGAIFLAAPQFLLAATPIMPRNDPDKLLTSGIFGFSRNPIYLGMVLILLGWGLILGAPPALAVPFGFAALIDRRFIREEEARLLARFPDQAPAYLARVRRWI
ncbi:isoprenylcysteine carboxylmethyltransferase family protein [Neomegalonema sp.]|uniref:methyltransferase family protein n=1 Tax=Neomegalonema sp. TaxID=2039713 RepID=UPI00263905E8|nr:isoprenylcysteine carboxylmethyltransferase family protein [Neomegalonema sp.]MDD2867035.1 isoprenylcysteine carboxylmethyltransferase family protein [Neomegalonema sp.]